MKETTCLFQKLRPVAFLLAAAICPLFLTQCKTTAGNYKDVEYDPSTLKTPSGHGLEKKEYPFDDSGNYRKDWVKTNARGKTRSASKIAETEVVDASTVASTDSTPSTGEYYGPSVGAGQGATELASSAPPVTTSAPAAPRYHKVASGDTLFSLASRYSTSVDELKRVNGLSGNTIRLGQSLRIP